LLDIELNERLLHEFSLNSWCSSSRPRLVRMTETKSIESDDAIALRESFEYRPPPTMPSAAHVYLQDSGGTGA
jgi:hypothetical protein